jgi:Zn-dependent protease with chaperone function
MEPRKSWQVPHICELLKRLQRTNRIVRRVVLLEALFVALLLCIMDWNHLANYPVATLVVCEIMVGPQVFSLLRISFQSKKALPDIHQDVKFGDHTKQDLLRYVYEVEGAMGLSTGATKVFLVREKSVNASAIQLGLAWLLPTLNAIYLNRGAIHNLRADELKSVIGHEIAHNQRHYLEWKRWTLLHLAFGLLLGLYLSSLCHLDSSLALVLALVALWVLELLQAMYCARYAHTIEFLCDAAGAQATDIRTAITAEVKIGHAAEVYERALLYALERKAAGSTATTKEVLYALEESLSFGQSDEAEVVRQLEERLSQG